MKYTRRNFLFGFKIGAILSLIRPLPKGVAAERCRPAADSSWITGNPYIIR